MEEKEIEVDGKKITVVVKLPKDQIESNNHRIYLDDTIDLKEIIKEITKDDKA